MSELKKKYTIAELENILNHDDRGIEIHPDGTVSFISEVTNNTVKPLTMKENLGGEYAI